MQGKFILVVDDEEAIRDLVTDVLTCEGYVVASASNGRAALHFIELVLPSLVLLDLHMPVLDGFGVITSLAARGIRVPIILVSAASHLRTHTTDCGAAAFIRKPFEILDLVTTVARHYPTSII